MINISKWLERCRELPEPPIIKEYPIFEKPKKIDVKEQLSGQLVNGIKDQALSLGWTINQLTDLQNILLCFIPCQIGLVTLQRISIELLHVDGSIRGAVSHYNHAVDQPWLTHSNKQVINIGQN